MVNETAEKIRRSFMFFFFISVGKNKIKIADAMQNIKNAGPQKPEFKMPAFAVYVWPSWRHEKATGV